MVQESLISIGKASHALGVSEAALRQWTDEGKLRAFITPGGHRRYSKADLKRFMSSPHKVRGLKDLVSQLEDTAHLHREIARKHLDTASRDTRFSQESRRHLAELSRHLLNLIIRYITEPSKREETIRLTHDIGHDFGKTLAKMGLKLTDSVEAFSMHRDPIMNAATRLMKRRESFTGRIAEAIPLVAHVMDEALVSLVAAHQQYRPVFPGDPEGGTDQ